MRSYYTLRLLIAIVVMLVCQQTLKADSVLLIASSWWKGNAPVPHLIEPQLTTAGHDVQIWEQSSLGWPPLDTLEDYDAVFFHGGERRRMGPIDSLLEVYAANGGRLVVEGANLSSNSNAYPEIRRLITKSKWIWGEDIQNLTCEVIDASHPLTTGLPPSFTLYDHSGRTEPNHSLIDYNGQLPVSYASNPNSIAISCAPRRAFLNHALDRYTSSMVRETVVVNAVNWVLSDPDDESVEKIEYELGHSPGDMIPVDVEIANWSTAPRTGKLLLEVSTDSSSWTRIDSVDYATAAGTRETHSLEWTPPVWSRYQLRATLFQDGTDDYPVNDQYVLTVSTLMNATHPKLFFTAAELPSLQTRAQTTHAGFYNALQASVDSRMSYNPPTQWESASVSYMALLLANASLYAVLSQSQSYIDYAVDFTMILCRYEHWETGYPDQDIYAGRTCRAVALAYDWLYDEFSKAQRDTVHLKLKAQCHRLNNAPANFIWWASAYMHNHHWVSWSHLGSACYALWEEEPYDAAEWEATALASLDDRFSLCGDVTDGSWYEAMNYWGLISWATLPHIYLAREQRGIDYFDTPFIQSLARYRVNASMPVPTRMPMINEAQKDEWYGPDAQLALLASEYNDGEAQWMRRQVIDILGYAIDEPFDFFFYDPSIEEAVPTDLSFICHDQDTYYGRSSWDSTATWVALKCGLPLGREAYTNFWNGGAIGDFAHSHFHADQNQLSIYLRGQYFVEGPGLHGSENLTRVSNTVLINGSGQFGDSLNGTFPSYSYVNYFDPHLADTSCTFDKIDYVVGDATTAYPPETGMTMFQRHLIFVRPNLVIVLDRLKASQLSTFTNILRNPNDIWTRNGDLVAMSQGGEELDLHVLAPDDWTSTTEFNWLYKTQTSNYGFLMENAVEDTSLQFFNLFYPPGDREQTVEKLVCNDSAAALFFADDTTFSAHVLLHYGTNGDTLDLDSVTTNARMAVVLSESIEETRTVAVKEATFLRWGLQRMTLFAASQPTSCEWTALGDTLRIMGQVSGNAAFYDTSSVVVTLNGTPTAFVRYGDYVVLGELHDWPVTNLTINRVGGVIHLFWTPEPGNPIEDPVHPVVYEIYRADGAVASFEYHDVEPGHETEHSDELVVQDDTVYQFYVKAKSVTPPAEESPEDSSPRAGAARKTAIVKGNQH